MKLVLPPEPGHGDKCYEIRVSKFGSFYINHVMGPVAFRPYGKRNLRVMAQIPGFDSTKGRLVKGIPYDGRTK